MATVKEVARIAGVSVATVSRVINDSGYVKPDLKVRVLQAMKALHYKPSALARSLRTKRTHNVGVLIPQIDHPFFGTLAFNIEKGLFERGYHCFTCSAEEKPEKEAAYIDALLSQKVDGCLVVPIGASPTAIQRLLGSGVPVVLVDRDVPDVPVDRVLSDNHGGACQVVRYVLGLGHRHMRIIGTSETSASMRARLRGVREACLNSGVPCEPVCYLQDSLDQFRAGYEAARQLLADNPRPTAIVALTDVIAIGVIHAAAELGLQIPRDLSVTGFDNITLASYVMPTLTTVMQDLQGLGREAVDLLVSRLENPDKSPVTRTLSTQLIVRQSTATPKTEGYQWL
jgi:LacI family transcriptional regulator